MRAREKKINKTTYHSDSWQKDRLCDVRCAHYFVNLPPFISLPDIDIVLVVRGGGGGGSGADDGVFVVVVVAISVQVRYCFDGCWTIDAKHFRQPNRLLISMFHVKNSKNSIDKFYCMCCNCIGLVLL